MYTCEQLFPAAASLSVHAHPAAPSPSFSYLLAHSPTLEHRTCPLFSLSLFPPSLLSLSSLPTLLRLTSCSLAGCGEEVGLGGVDCHVHEREIEGGKE